MNNKKFDIYLDLGSSKIRVGAINKTDSQNSFYYESNYFSDPSNAAIEIEKIIHKLESDTNEYLDNVKLMVDSYKIKSIELSLSKKFDGSKLQKKHIEFLIQDAKQQILRNY